MNKDDAFREINEIQDYYVSELISRISKENDVMKKINFTSPTGTGKTKMMSKLINSFPEYYFIITTLSKGQLNRQISASLDKDCIYGNYRVYGTADFRINSILEAQDIIGRIPAGKKCVWLRDEGHIATNRFDDILLDICYKVVNFSATNKYDDIKCNFTSTMMLRTVKQDIGTPESAIKKLVEIKEQHKMVKNYNPCAIFRCIKGSESIYNRIVLTCEKYNLKYIDLNDDSYIMAELCEDNNEYDVIINKMKLVEGIDIRRAHVLYMDSQPRNDATTIQTIGRCRRNALLYRDDIDIFAPENSELLKNTRVCYAFFNVERMNISTDENGELCYAFCDKISCESLKPNSHIYVENGRLMNGLLVVELEGKSGWYDIEIDDVTGFNVVDPKSDFYRKEIFEAPADYIYVSNKKIYKENIDKLPIYHSKYVKNYELGIFDEVSCKPYRKFEEKVEKNNAIINISDEVLNLFEEYVKKYTSRKGENLVASMIKDVCLDKIIDEINELIKESEVENIDSEYCKNEIEIFVKNYQGVRGYNKICTFIRKYQSNNFEPDILLLIKFLCTKNKLKSNECDCEFIVKTIERLIEIEDRLEINGIDVSKIAVYSLENKANFLKVKNYIIRLESFISNNTEVAFKPFSITKRYDERLEVTKDDVITYFELELPACLRKINDNKRCYLKDSKIIVNNYKKYLSNTLKKLKEKVIPIAFVDYGVLFEDISSFEKELLNSGEIRQCYDVEVSEVKNSLSNRICKIWNEKESAIIGTDLMKIHKVYEKGFWGGWDSLVDSYWSESTAVTSKIGRNTKLDRYISQKYEKELLQSKNQLFSGENYFSFDKRCNSCLGYCVEYYSKYLVYGEKYLQGFIKNSYKKNNDAVIVRACIDKYRKMMAMVYGDEILKVIKTISIEQLCQKKYAEFVNAVVEFGTRTSFYVKDKLYKNCPAINNISPNLSIRHISGLADYITEDTILDVKVTNNITERHVRQVLAYHYLSTKRSDLHINRLIIYDATSGKDVVIHL